ADRRCGEAEVVPVELGREGDLPVYSPAEEPERARRLAVNHVEGSGRVKLGECIRGRLQPVGVAVGTAGPPGRGVDEMPGRAQVLCLLQAVEMPRRDHLDLV